MSSVFIQPGDVAFYMGALLTFLSILTVFWKVIVSRMVTKEDLLKELLDLREFLRKNFVAKK